VPAVRVLQAPGQGRGHAARGAVRRRRGRVPAGEGHAAAAAAPTGERSRRTRPRPKENVECRDDRGGRPRTRWQVQVWWFRRGEDAAGEAVGTSGQCTSDSLMGRGRERVGGLQRVSVYASPYLDAHGEEDVYLKRGKPLHLSQLRYAAIQNIWRALALDSDSHTLHTARLAGEDW
jgi:hypothetical protein